MSLVLTHAKYQFLETARIPIALVSTIFFPSASMLAFVVPFAGDDPVAATLATGSMVTFAVMLTCLFHFGTGVAEDRGLPWDAYTRTLPSGPWPRFAGRLLNALGFVLVAIVPVVLIAALFTEATITPSGLLLGVGAVVAAAVPFTLLGLTLGYLLPVKAALAVTNIIFFPLAIGGGLLTNPEQAPAFIDAVAPFLPTRGAVELVWAATTDRPLDALAIGMLAVWVLVSGVLAVWAYRRDEGRRFR